jgi:hypothetical protein
MWWPQESRKFSDSKNFFQNRLTWDGDSFRLRLDDVPTSQNFWEETLEPRSVMEGTLLLAFFFFSGNWFDHTDDEEER